MEDAELATDADPGDWRPASLGECWILDDTESLLASDAGGLIASTVPLCASSSCCSSMRVRIWPGVLGA
jgi:hypothetical protein